LNPGIYLNNVLKIHLLLNKKHSVSIIKDRPGDAVSEIIAVWYANHTKSIDTLWAYRELLKSWSGVVRIVTIVLERITEGIEFSRNGSCNLRKEKKD
jgi:hypothetical protein